MNVIGYIASPRMNGSTAWTVSQILEGAKEQGAQTQAFYAGALDIRPCKGCLGCTKTGKCVIDDDMQRLYAALKQADALVLGTPVYMGQMTAQAKTFIDRLFAQITPRFSPKFKEENAGKKLVLAFTQGNPNPDMFKDYFDYTEKMLRLLEFDVRAVQVVAGTRGGPACEQEGLQAILKNIGAGLH